MKKILLSIMLTPYLLLAGYHADISSISPAVKKRMIQGGSWRKGCPVPLSNLRYLTMTYRGFDGKDHRGEMIVHQSVAREVTEIFGKLYSTHYPIRKMRLVSDYRASDFQSIEADNTSAFNCRAVTGGKKWSRHSYGKAIDINPIENPYISRSGRISHKASLKYRVRDHSHSNATILKSDTIVKLFKAKGWRWGGDWNSIKDYQHFDKR
jgi:poly-gamma-glutamate synthesis protein (capsule biosynthesis protein)